MRMPTTVTGTIILTAMTTHDLLLGSVLPVPVAVSGTNELLKLLYNTVLLRIAEGSAPSRVHRFPDVREPWPPFGRHTRSGCPFLEDDRREDAWWLIIFEGVVAIHFE